MQKKSPSPNFLFCFTYYDVTGDVRLIKKTYLTSFWGFWDFEKKPFRGFFLNFAKICQKNVPIT